MFVTRDRDMMLKNRTRTKSLYINASTRLELTFVSEIKYYIVYVHPNPNAMLSVPAFPPIIAIFDISIFVSIFPMSILILGI